MYNVLMYKIKMDENYFSLILRKIGKISYDLKDNSSWLDSPDLPVSCALFRRQVV